MAAPASTTPVPAGRVGGIAVSWQTAGQLVSVLVQLGLAALVIRQFQLESRTFFEVFLLAVAAFPLHAVLPLRLRLPFFAAVSLLGIALVFGPVDGAALVAAGLALIAVCHLPISFGGRVLALLAVAGALALARAGAVPSPVSAAVWPILGSMFMFRLALYLHALKHDPTPPTAARTLAYFFMLPNVCYPLFPVVDYTTFGRTHYDGDPFETYQRGVKWIARGLVHLLLYRFVYLHLTLNVTQIKTLGDLVQSLLAVFLLYLRVSGQFHLIVGVLHLFGFRLPETHRLYYLASSLTDYWRRINIYWKDFMMKLVFYPSFFKLRKRGDRVALAGATMLVFFATWLLHSYQWFWLRSEFPVTPQDLLFWGILGGMVVINSLREAKRGRKRTLSATKSRWQASLAVRTVATFAALCLLWSLWSADSLVDWLWMWRAAADVDAKGLLLLGGLLAAGLAVGGVIWDAPVAPAANPARAQRRQALQTAAVLATLLILSVPVVQTETGPRIAGLIKSLQSVALNDRDAALGQAGYYENLDDRGRLSMQLWNTIAERPPDWFADTTIYRNRPKEFLSFDLTPSSRTTRWGQTVTINRWGMRDRDYTLEKPAGTVRIALLGPSFVMGYGVADSDTYDTYLESRLNGGAQPPRRYEVLNFGVGGYSMLHQLRLLDERVYQFDPDVVIVTDARHPVGPVVKHLRRILDAEARIPYPGLEAIIAKARVEAFPGRGVPIPTDPLRRLVRATGFEARMPWREATLRLHSVADEMIQWSFRHMAEQARAHGAVPVFVDGLLPTDTTVADSPMMRSARSAGFLVLNMSDIYNGQDRERLQVASWDTHPNAAATRIIAERLYQEFQRHEAELRLGVGDSALPDLPAQPGDRLLRSEGDSGQWTRSRAPSSSTSSTPSSPGRTRRR